MPSDEWENPIADGASFEIEPSPVSNMSDTIGLNQVELSDEELVDLTYAFKAADMSGEGKLSYEEFCFLLDVMGCDLDAEQSRQLMADAKSGFATWLKTTDDRSREECRKIWETFDANHDGKLDLNEVNAVIVELRRQGFTPSILSPEDVGGGLKFEEFCTCVCSSGYSHTLCTRSAALTMMVTLRSWFVAQDSLGKFKVPSQKMRISLPTKRKKGQKPVVPPASVSAAEGLLEQSTKM